MLGLAESGNPPFEIGVRIKECKGDVTMKRKAFYIIVSVLWIIYAALSILEFPYKGILQLILILAVSAMIFVFIKK